MNQQLREILDNVHLYKFVDGVNDEPFDLPEKAKDMIEQQVIDYFLGIVGETEDVFDSPEKYKAELGIDVRKEDMKRGRNQLRQSIRNTLKGKS